MSETEKRFTYKEYLEHFGSVEEKPLETPEECAQRMADQTIAILSAAWKEAFAPFNRHLTTLTQKCQEQEREIERLLELLQLVDDGAPSEAEVNKGGLHSVHMYSKEIIACRAVLKATNSNPHKETNDGKS